MGMAVGSGGRVKAEPNVVPMIDIMLVLLIIFMIVTPALLSGFTAQPPEGVNLKQHPEDDADIVLGVDREGKYYLNKDPIRSEDLEQALRNIYGAPDRAEFILYIRADRAVEYQRVLDAMQVASKSGVRVVAAITEQQKGTEAPPEN
jgi:biopolymer transport protein TolR